MEITIRKRRYALPEGFTTRKTHPTGEEIYDEYGRSCTLFLSGYTPQVGDEQPYVQTCALSGSRRIPLIGLDDAIPPLVGYAEAAEILGWDKRRIGTYMQRGAFPDPIQRLASGPVWTQQQIEDYRDSHK